MKSINIATRHKPVPAATQAAAGQGPGSETGHSALRIAVLALLLWLPVPAGSNWGWASALMMCLVAILALARTLLPGHRHPLPAATLAALALLAAVTLWIFLQWWLGLSADPGETFRYGLLSLTYALLFWLVISLFRTRRHLTLLLATLVVSGTLQAFFGAFMTLSGLEWLAFDAKEHGRGVVTGTFVNRNHMAGYLELTLACGIGLMLALRDGKPFNWRNILELLLSTKMKVRIALAIMVIALVMTQSRMGNTAFVTSLLLVGALFVLANPRHRLRNSLILASLVAIDLLIISQYFGLENLKNRLLATQLEDQVVDGTVVRRENVDRDDIARYVMAQFRERPLVGFGAGSFEASFPRHAGPDVRLDFDHAHNDILQFATELGLIGLLPLAAFTLLCLWHALVALWQAKSLYRGGVGFGAAMGIVALMIHASSDFNLQIPANAATFVVVCAIALLARQHHTHSSPPPPA